MRLKGGDPFVFGRGGEEAEALRAAGVAFEVVPGVTAGVAAPAYAGIPVTHRDDASAVAFVTGHEDPEKDEIGARLGGAGARFPGTLVFYMGVKRLAEIAAALIAAGRDPDEPAAAIERGTMAGPAHRRRHPRDARRGGRARAARRRRRSSSSGPVAARREALAWLERRPLHGRRVVVTRARAQASGLAATLRALGAEVVELPAIRIEPRIDSDEVRDAVDGAAHLRARLPDQPQRRPAALRGDGRAGPRRARARQRDRRRDRPGHRARRWPSTASIADVVPERFVAEALVEALGGGRGRGPAGPGRPRGRGPRRAPRRAARARRRGRRRRPLRDGARGARPRGGRGRAGGRLRHLHLLLDRPQPRRGARRADARAAPGSSRSAR